MTLVEEADEWAQKINTPWMMLATLGLTLLVNVAPLILAILGLVTPALNPLVIPGPMGIANSIISIVVRIVMIACGVVGALLYQFMVAPQIEDMALEQKTHIIFCVSLVLAFVANAGWILLFGPFILVEILGSQPIWEAFN